MTTRTIPTLPPGLVAIHDPKKPGDYRVLGIADYNPAEHVLFSEPLPKKTETHRPGGAPLGTPAAPVGEVSPGTESSGKAGEQPPADTSNDTPKKNRGGRPKKNKGAPQE